MTPAEVQKGNIGVCPCLGPSVEAGEEEATPTCSARCHNGSTDSCCEGCAVCSSDGVSHLCEPVLCCLEGAAGPGTAEGVWSPDPGGSEMGVASELGGASVGGANDLGGTSVGGAKGSEHCLAPGESMRRFGGGASELSPDNLFDGPEQVVSGGVKGRSGAG